MPPDALKTGLVVVAIAVALFFVLFLFAYGRLWIQAMSSGVHVSLLTLIGMTLRKVSASVIVNQQINAHKAGLPIVRDQMEAHYMAGGNVQHVIRALIAAYKAKIDLDWDRACAIDLAGRDILEAVNTSVNPRVIDCPDSAQSGRMTIDAVSKDGIQLKARARVTVRTCIERLVGGATEETIIARVGEGIVSAIGSANTHKEVLENPDKISRTVLQKGLDSGTAFEILSIDIADIDVGVNIGAKLQADQAEADMRVARAEAEKRRALAVAREQEMQAQVVENRAKVVLAEAEIPKAMAQAFREGNLGVMDYFNMRNIQADTDMRKRLAGTGEEDQTPEQPDN